MVWAFPAAEFSSFGASARLCQVIGIFWIFEHMLGWRMHHTMKAQDSELRRNYEFPTGIRGIGMI
jgi:hypothetical protein